MPDPMTPEQLAFFSRQTERAVRKAVKKYAHRSLVGFLFLVTVIGFVQWDSSTRGRDSRDAIVDSGRVIAVDGCNRDFTTIASLRNILIASKGFQIRELKAGRITQEQFQRATSHYDEQLMRLGLPDCRNAKTILSGDPGKTVRVPTPRYPGDRG